MWKCSLIGEAKLACQSFGTAYRLNGSLLREHGRCEVQDVFFENTCRWCTDWHNSPEYAIHLNNIAKAKSRKNAHLVSGI